MLNFIKNLFYKNSKFQGIVYKDIESTINAEILIKSMSGGKRTIIIITHDVYQAGRIADYVLFMDKGKVIEMGLKDKVLKNPENNLVKQLMNMKI